MLPKEYRTISNLSGPLLVVESTENVRYDELVEIELPSGERRRGRVLEISRNNATKQQLLSQSAEPNTSSWQENHLLL